VTRFFWAPSEGEVVWRDGRRRNVDPTRDITQAFSQARSLFLFLTPTTYSSAVS